MAWRVPHGPPRSPSWRGMEVALDLSEAVRLYFSSSVRVGAAHCDGHFDAEDRCPPEARLQAASSLMVAHMRLPAVGDSMNINKLYFTFIAFLLGFHGDGVCEWSSGAEL